jgi:hypothetical protein
VTRQRIEHARFLLALHGFPTSTTPGDTRQSSHRIPPRPSPRACPNRERAAFHRFLFHANWDAPDLYDLTINTGGISVKTAADLIVKAGGAKEMTGKKREASRRLRNLSLAQKAIVAVLFEQKLPIRCLEIECDDGAIALRGTARDRPSIERCRETAADVCNARRVTNGITFNPRYVELMGGISGAAAERMIV